MALRVATDIFLRKAQECSAVQGGDASTLLESSYNREVERIDRELQQHRQQKAEVFIAPLYRRRCNPAAEEVLHLLRETSKLFELNLRFKDIEKLDDMHTKLWKLLNKGGRMHLTLEEYREVLNAFSRADAPPRKDCDEGNPSLSCDSSLCVAPLPSNELRELLYLPLIEPPRLGLALGLSCPSSGGNNSNINSNNDTAASRGIDAATIYQTFAKQVSLVKCEAELLMWDTDNDGRLTEDEVESYVGDLVPRIAALRGMAESNLPFYCCTVTRRIFWDLDQGNHGFIRIGALLRSSVMDEWVTLQLQTEDSPNSWFGAMATQQLYAKFLLLDTRNTGTLDAERLKLYKKGLPTIIDDGLPFDISPLSSLFIDRYFETNTMTANRDMDYRRFVDFVVAVEMLPQCSRPVFWWDILDLDGSGLITPLKANFFFKETHAKLVSAKLEVPSIESVIQEAFDLIPSAEPLCIRREEFIASPQAGLFAGMLVDCLCFWAYESREHR